MASGYRFQVTKDCSQELTHLWQQRPPRYSRALLETLSLIAYRQPITRAEIEAVRGVSVSTTIVRTLMERRWVKIVGYRDVPGKPALYATTNDFLDYFCLKSLSELPSLKELADIAEQEHQLTVQLERAIQGEKGEVAESGVNDEEVVEVLKNLI